MSGCTSRGKRAADALRASPACTSDRPARSRVSAASARRIWMTPPARHTSGDRAAASGTLMNSPWKNRGKRAKRNSMSVAMMPATTNSPTVHSTAPVSSVPRSDRGALMPPLPTR